MRLHRLAVRDFAGIREAEIEPALGGVTIVSGPNERGKSSLVRAIDLILREPDSSTKAAVRALQPVGRDVGPRVELELSSGPYRFVYVKQWCVGRHTELRVLEPRPQNLTGRDAHDRVREILDETLDEPLLRALWYEQGAAVAQASLGESLSLQHALDAASGSAIGGETEATLYQRVRAEWERYFTPGRGQPVAQRADLAARLARAEEDLAQARDELAHLESDAGQVTALDERIERLERRREALETAHRTAADAWTAVERLDEERQRMQLVADARALERDQAAAAVKGRRELVDAEMAAERVLAELEDGARRDAPLLAQARTARDDAVAAREAARVRRDAAEAAAAAAGTDLRTLQWRRELGLLERRRQTLADAQLERQQAQALLEGCSVTDAVLDELRALADSAVRARAAASGETPQLRIDAQAPLCVEGSVLAPGGTWEAPVAGRLEVALADEEGRPLARLCIEGGATGRRQEEDALRAEEALRAACRRAGVEPPTLAAATDLNRTWNRAVATEASARRAIDQALQGFTPDEMDARIALLGERARARREPPPATDEPGAEAALDRMTAEARAAQEHAGWCEGAADEAVAAYERLDGDARLRAARHETAQRVLDAARRALDVARKEASDDDLLLAFGARDSAAATAQEDAARCRTALEEADPGAARLLYDNARDALGRAAAEREQLVGERLKLEGRVTHQAEQGLYDRVARAESAVRDLRREQEATDRRAAAADVLYRVLTREREVAQRSYVAPYKAALDRLAAVVFGPGTTLEVSHDTLRIESRTLAGETVPFESLSVGAKEQLAILARLAAARLVAPGAAPGGAERAGEARDAGVPVVLDDALGSSDPHRLERMGALLAEAGADLQVLVLTCDPERYAFVGNAHHVAL